MERRFPLSHDSLVSQMGSPALVLAAQRGSVDAIRVLLDHGADLEVRDGVRLPGGASMRFQAHGSLIASEPGLLTSAGSCCDEVGSLGATSRREANSWR